MEMSRNWIIAEVDAVGFITGVALSHAIEPGVRVEKIMLTTKTPALRIMAMFASYCIGQFMPLFY